MRITISQLDLAITIDVLEDAIQKEFDRQSNSDNPTLVYIEEYLPIYKKLIKRLCKEKSNINYLNCNNVVNRFERQYAELKL